MRYCRTAAGRRMSAKHLSTTLFRWSIGVKIAAASWFLALLSAWLHGEITSWEVIEFGAIPGAVYWTFGSFVGACMRGV